MAVVEFCGCPARPDCPISTDPPKMIHSQIGAPATQPAICIGRIHRSVGIVWGGGGLGINSIINNI